MIDITGLREDKRPQSSTIVHALLDRLEAAEKERDDVAQQLVQSEQGKRKISEECDALRAKIAEMERQEPVAFALYSGWARKAVYLSEIEACEQRDRRQLTADLGGSLEAYRVAPLYLAPGAQPAPFDDNATIAGLESAVTHLSVLLDSFRALLVEVNDVCGRDGHGGQLEDGESEIIDKVRAAISMTEAPPCAKGEEK